MHGGVATGENWDDALYDLKRLFISLDNIIISKHAGARMFERGVSAEDLITLIRNGEIIEEYRDDYRCPAVLMLG